MAKDNGGESPQVREVGDAPNITRLLNEQITRKTFLSSWSSPERFAKHIQDGSSDQCWYKSNVYADCSKNWNGVNSVAEAIDLAYHGWAEGGALIEKTRGYIKALNPLSPKLVKYGIAGATPNVPRAIAGNILNMRVPEKKNSLKKKTITIVYNMCESCGNSAEAISNKAAVMAALIDEIEAKGFSCEVIACAATNNSKIRVVTSVCVKESHQPVDINRLAFSLGHAAMFRVMFFADWQKDHFCSDLGYGLGIVSTTQPDPDQNTQNIYTITSGVYSNRIKISDFNTMEDAATKGLNSIVKELQRQGCPAFPKLTEHEDASGDEEVVEPPEYEYDW